jgi:hypothetical protein
MSGASARFRLPAVLTVLLLGAWGTPAFGALPCQSPTADPCVLGSSVTVPVGVYDIRPKSLVLQNKAITVSGVGEFKILANNITIQPGGRFLATTTDGATTVTLDATGFIDIQSQGTSKSKINVTGSTSGGGINLHSGGNLGLNGTLASNATATTGYGGFIFLRSETGNVTITGDPDVGIQTIGSSLGGGGTIDVEAPLGSISVASLLAAKAGDCSGCEVDLTAGLDISTTATGVINMNASGIGDGGFFSAFAGRNISLLGNMLANGHGDDMEGGSGGDFFIQADGSLALGGRIELNGAPPDGDGGTADISAGTTIVQSATAPILATSPGFGQSDEISFDALGNITLNGTIDVSADDFGGDITVTSEGLITVTSRLRTATPFDPLKPEAFAGTIDIEGCQFNETSTGDIIATGPGAEPVGSVFLTASTGMTIAGHVTATAVVELDWRTSAPVRTGSVIVPAPRIVNVPGLPCCGVSCTTTTTTSTSTTTSSPVSTTTSTSRPTTTSTSTTRPTTTSTSSTTSTSTTRPTTTSTSTSSSTTTSRASTTTSSSTTSTTLLSACPSAPATTCLAGGKGTLQVNEKSFGKEKLKLVIDKIVPPVSGGQLGDPAAGTTAYTICLYDESHALAGALKVDRAGAACSGATPCWKAVSGPGFKYNDKLLVADGVQQIVLKSGAAGRAKVTVKGKNDIGNHRTNLPVGVAAHFLGDRSATAQVLSSNAACFSLELATVKDADGKLFKAVTP